MSDLPKPREIRGSFATTRWSMVVDAGRPSSNTSRMALEQLCEQYWQPLYAYALRRGHQTSDAQDLTQSFFVDLLRHEWVKRADATKGRFRTFLLTAFDRFATSKWRRDNAEKRGGKHSILSIDFDAAEDWAAKGCAAEKSCSPHDAFQRRWAVTVLQNVVDQLRAEYEEAGKAELFAALEGQWNAQASSAAFAEVGELLGMTPGSVKVSAHRLRQRYRQILRSLVRETVQTDEEVDPEIQELMSVFSKSV